MCERDIHLNIGRGYDKLVTVRFSTSFDGISCSEINIIKLIL
ncbi:hypothetical protein VIBNIAM115_1710013 [Vibrio nigripulchritudo AM115]|nr:hypothetical protein VIBNIAM115_1710013 [Vibrio nigripulchritudo AM115]